MDILVVTLFALAIILLGIVRDIWASKASKDFANKIRIAYFLAVLFCYALVVIVFSSVEDYGRFWVFHVLVAALLIFRAFYRGKT
jgi:hypothetical protein